MAFGRNLPLTVAGAAAASTFVSPRSLTPSRGPCALAEGIYVNSEINLEVSRTLTAMDLQQVPARVELRTYGRLPALINCRRAIICGGRVG